jgi:hypothetical protein
MHKNSQSDARMPTVREQDYETTMRPASPQIHLSFSRSCSSSCLSFPCCDESLNKDTRLMDSTTADIVRRHFSILLSMNERLCWVVQFWRKKHYKSQFPTLNVSQRNEPIATDTVYSDTPAIDGGDTTSAQFVLALRKRWCVMLTVLDDNIREWGAMSKLVSDQVQVDISKLKYKDCYGISWFQAGKVRLNSNSRIPPPAEQRYKTTKPMTNTLLDQSGFPVYTWLCCLTYVCFLMNHRLGRIPLQWATGLTVDISVLLLHFHWYEVWAHVLTTRFMVHHTLQIHSKNAVNLLEYQKRAYAYELLSTGLSNSIEGIHARSTSLRPGRDSSRIKLRTGVKERWTWIKVNGGEAVKRKHCQSKKSCPNHWHRSSWLESELIARTMNFASKPEQWFWRSVMCYEARSSYAGRPDHDQAM